LYVTPKLMNINSITSETTMSSKLPTEIIALTLSSIVENPLLTTDNKQRSGLTTDFYLHG